MSLHLAAEERARERERHGVRALLGLRVCVVRYYHVFLGDGFFLFGLGVWGSGFAVCGLELRAEVSGFGI